MKASTAGDASRAAAGPEGAVETRFTQLNFTTEAIMGFLAIVVLGLIAGVLARAIVPGRSGMGIPATIVLGIVGSFVGGFLGSLLYTHQGLAELQLSGLLFSTIGAIVVLVIVNRVGLGRGS